MFTLRRQKPSLIALDMNSEELRLLRFKPGLEGFLIENYALLPLPQGAIQDGRVHQFDVVLAAVRQLVKHTEATGLTAVMAIPSGAVMSKRVKLTGGLRNREREQQIHHNLTQYFRQGEEELCFDFSVLNRVPSQEEEVLVVASSLPLIHTYVMMATLSGLNIRAIDVDVYAEKRALTFQEIKKAEVMPQLDGRNFDAAHARWLVCFGLAMRGLSS